VNLYVPGANPAFAPVPAVKPEAYSGGAVKTMGSPRAGIPIDPRQMASFFSPTDGYGVDPSRAVPNIIGASIYTVLPDNLGPWNRTGASHYNVSPVPSTPGTAAQPNIYAPIPPAGPSIATMPWPRVVPVWPLRAGGKNNNQ
jgi:hypothetical protein